MKLTVPTEKNITKTIPPNYGTWETIELTYQCAKYVVDNRITGSFVECGIAAGNNLAAMCKAGRHGYGYDSFEGIPWAGPKDTEQPGIGSVSMIDPSKIGVLESSGITSHSMDQVKVNMEKWGISNYSLVKGWFQNTVPKWLGEIAVLRLDGDLYDSTYVCLQYLYPSLNEGGILIVDDWRLGGCRQAFEDYFSGRSMEGRPKMILDDGVTYWQK